MFSIWVSTNLFTQVSSCGHVIVQVGFLYGIRMMLVALFSFPLYSYLLVLGCFGLVMSMCSFVSWTLSSLAVCGIHPGRSLLNPLVRLFGKLFGLILLYKCRPLGHCHRRLFLRMSCASSLLVLLTGPMCRVVPVLLPSSSWLTRS